MNHPLAQSPGARKLGCLGCHDDWNRHPKAPRSTKPLRCPHCPVHRVLKAVDLRKVSLYGRGDNPYGEGYVPA